MNRAKECDLNDITVEKGFARLVCPKTEEIGDGKGYTAQSTGNWKRDDDRAVSRVRKLAGNAACGSCRYFGKSRAEVDELKGQEAAAKATRILGENELLAAQAERNKLLGELGLTSIADAGAPQIAEAGLADNALITPPEDQPPAAQR